VHVCSLTYPAHNMHALYHIVICGLSGSTTIFHIISYMAQFLAKEVTEHKLCALIFSTTFVWYISHSKNSEWHYHKCTEVFT